MLEENNNEMKKLVEVSTNKRRLYRQKVAYSICMCFSYIALGLIACNTDSALLELKRITSVTLEEAALYATMMGVGFLFGSILCGAIYTRIDKFLSQASIWLMTAMVVAIIPWCNSHVGMATAHAIIGGLIGFLDTVAIAEILAVWGTDGGSFMHALNLGYTVGGVISPLLVAMFTNIPCHDKASFYETTARLPNTTSRMNHFPQTVGSNSNSNVISNNTLIPIDDHQQFSLLPGSTSRIYIVYVISACICAISGIPYFVMFFLSSRDIYSESSPPEMTSSIEGCWYWKIAVLANTGVLLAVYAAMSETSAGFLVAFCVTQMNWKVGSGALLLAFMEGCFSFGLFLSMFCVRYIKPHTILGIFLPLVCIMFAIMTWCGFNVSDYGFSISIGLLGLLMSVILPAIYTWTEESFPVTGKIASLFNVAQSIGAITSPIVAGILMDRQSPMCYAYISIATSLMMILLYLVGFLLSRQSRSNNQG